MDIAGQRQFRRANAAAGAFVRLEHGHRLARLSENNCRGETVRTRADHHGIVGRRFSHTTAPCLSHEDNPRSKHTAWKYSPAQKYSRVFVASPHEWARLANWRNFAGVAVLGQVVCLVLRSLSESP